MPTTQPNGVVAPASDGAAAFTDEVAAFVLHNQTVTTIEGQTSRVPKITYGKELLVATLLGGAVEELQATGILRDTETSPYDIAASFTAKLLKHAPQKLGEVCAVLLCENQQDDGPTEADVAAMLRWVKANLTLREVTNLVFPFLSHESVDLGATVGPIVQGLMTQALQASSGPRLPTSLTT